MVMPANDDPRPGEFWLDSQRGRIRVVYRAVEGATRALLAVGGTDGGLDGPADALYPDLAEDLAAHGIATLRVDFRGRIAPGIVDEGIFDVLTGLEYLAREHGIERVGLVGHSYGGAVVIAAAAQSPEVATVATLAAQTAGAQPVVELAPRPLLLIHGLDDIRLSPDCSRLLYRMAGEPKRLVLLEGARHSLRQSREEVRTLLVDWFTETLVP